MNTTGKVTAFAVALAAAFAGAYGIGTAAEPVDQEPKAEAHDTHAGKKDSERAGGEKGEGKGAAEPPGGLQVSDGGYRLDLRTPRVSAGEKEKLRFTVRDAKGRALKAYEKEQTKELHLVLASRDLGTYRHLHPERDKSGEWSARTELPRSGDYRLFADFVPRGADEGLTLGADLAVRGEYEPEALPEPSRTVTVEDGYRVKLDGTLKAGQERKLTLNVTKDGKPVSGGLQPYLGASGHLVALRAGDLGYLHVHPSGASGSRVSFMATAPTEGGYRLFLDFKHGDEVRTAAFTVGAGGTAKAGSSHEGEGSGGHGH
ncbi:hypothetical protein GCM10009801_39140 [Streptomyces albiaxialis]|uniref:Secreted protein n=1 Tax=Streptomyces albiaxialis TaxID=329523 RepID=A0ABN2W3V0_9ACTN